MNKYIKFILFILVGFVFTTSFVFAKEKTNQPKIRNQQKEIIENNKEGLVNEVNTARGKTKSQITEANKAFKKNISKIKNEKRRTNILNIVNKIQELNDNAVDNFSDSIVQIEDLLNNIEERTKEAQLNKGLKVDGTLSYIAKARVSISEAKAFTVQQSIRIYTTNITTENKTIEIIKLLRDTFQGDVNNLQNKVKVARDNTKDAAISLAKDQGIYNNQSVEKGDTTNTNN